MTFDFLHFSSNIRFWLVVPPIAPSQKMKVVAAAALAVVVLLILDSTSDAMDCLKQSACFRRELYKVTESKFFLIFYLTTK